RSFEASVPPVCHVRIITNKLRGQSWVYTVSASDSWESSTTHNHGYWTVDPLKEVVTMTVGHPEHGNITTLSDRGPIEALGPLACDLHPAVHHLVPGLQAPAHVLRRVGVARVVGRIIPLADPGDLGPLGDGDRLGKSIHALPVEIVIRHGKQGFGA